MPDVMGFIPARGGSKGIPRKNLYPVMGKPLLQYTIEAAKSSRHINRTMLSSEDTEICNFARHNGIDTRYTRPAALATDETTTIDVVLHALDWLEAHHELPDILVLLQPTSPLRTGKHIDTAIKKFQNSSRNSLVSVHSMIEHPWKCLQTTDSGWKFLARPEQHVSRRQEYNADYFAINGALYIATPAFIRQRNNFVAEDETVLFSMSPTAGVDVDELPDIFQVEALLKTAATG